MKKTRNFWIARDARAVNTRCVFRTKPHLDKFLLYWEQSSSARYGWFFKWPKLRPGECVKVRMVLDD